LSVTHQQIRQCDADQLSASGTTFNRERFMAQRIAAIPGDQGLRYLQVELRTSLLVLFGATCAVLLILGANLANLMMARATVRAPETAVRLALSAGRWRLLRQWLTEGIVLSILGGAVGIVIALWIKAGLMAFIPQDYRANLDVANNWRLYLFILGLAIVIGLAFSLVPAIQVARQSFVPGLRLETRSFTSAGRRGVAAFFSAGAAAAARAGRGAAGDFRFTAGFFDRGRVVVAVLPDAGGRVVRVRAGRAVLLMPLLDRVRAG
jgi:predicted lysophospholipase L1 biosynthesis ABC-type transport system permease subunit